MRGRRLPALLWLTVGLVALSCLACAKGQSELSGWRALQPGTEMCLKGGAGPSGETVLEVRYTIAPGMDCAIEREGAGLGLSGSPTLLLQAKATRALQLALVLVDSGGDEHACAHTLRPGDWQELRFATWTPGLDDWDAVESLRLVDRTGGLGGQGPVSLKLLGLPLE